MLDALDARGQQAAFGNFEPIICSSMHGHGVNTGPQLPIYIQVLAHIILPQ